MTAENNNKKSINNTKIMKTAPEGPDMIKILKELIDTDRGCLERQPAKFYRTCYQNGAVLDVKVMIFIIILES